MSKHDFFKREDSYKRAKQMRKEWKQGKHASYTVLAYRHGVSEGFARSVIAGKKCVRRKPPKGNYKKANLYGSIYYVYPDGKIWSKALNRLTNARKDKSGYYVFNVAEENGNRHKIRLHRLVLMTFDRKPKRGEIGRHLNDIKSDNRIENLEWGTHQDNVDDMMRNDTVARGEDVYTAKLTEKIVKRLMKEYKPNMNADEFAFKFIEKHKLEVSTRTILSVLRGKYWTHVTGLSIRKLPMKSGKKLDDKAVRSIHRNWQKNVKFNQIDFCRKFAEYLNTKGYDIAWRTVKKVLNGGTWKSIYDEFN